MKPILTGVGDELPPELNEYEPSEEEIIDFMATEIEEHSHYFARMLLEMKDGELNEEAIKEINEMAERARLDAISLKEGE